MKKKEKKTIWKRPQAKGRRFCNGGHSFHLVMLTRLQICCNNAMSPRWYVSNCDIDLTGDICPSTSCSLVLWVTMTILLIFFFSDRRFSLRFCRPTLRRLPRWLLNPVSGSANPAPGTQSIIQPGLLIIINNCLAQALWVPSLLKSATFDEFRLSRDQWGREDGITRNCVSR